MQGFSPCLWTAGPEGPRWRCERRSSSGWRAAQTWAWWGSHPDGPRRPPRPGAWPLPPAAACSQAGPRCCRGKERRHGETQPGDWVVSALEVFFLEQDKDLTHPPSHNCLWPLFWTSLKVLPSWHHRTFLHHWNTKSVRFIQNRYSVVAWDNQLSNKPVGLDFGNYIIHCWCDNRQDSELITAASYCCLFLEKKKENNEDVWYVFFRGQKLCSQINFHALCRMTISIVELDTNVCCFISNYVLFLIQSGWQNCGEWRQNTETGSRFGPSQSLW